MAGRFRITTLGGSVADLEGGVFYSRDRFLETYLNLKIRMEDMDSPAGDPEVQMIEAARKLLPDATIEELRREEPDERAIY